MITIQIKFHIDSQFKAPEIVICNDTLNASVKQLADTISRAVNNTVTGADNRGTVVLTISEIIRIYAEKQRVMADTARGTFTLRHKLYELEEMLRNTDMIRISKSELVNFHQIDRLDTSLAGIIVISLRGGRTSYVSRRYVSLIKKELEVRGGR